MDCPYLDQYFLESMLILFQCKSKKYYTPPELIRLNKSNRRVDLKHNSYFAGAWLEGRDPEDFRLINFKSNLCHYISRFKYNLRKILARLVNLCTYTHASAANLDPMGWSVVYSLMYSLVHVVNQGVRNIAHTHAHMAHMVCRETPVGYLRVGVSVRHYVSLISNCKCLLCNVPVGTYLNIDATLREILWSIISRVLRED